MISLEKCMILATLQKLPKNVGDLGKFMVAKGFKKLPKVQKIANYGQTFCNQIPRTRQRLGQKTGKGQNLWLN